MRLALCLLLAAHLLAAQTAKKIYISVDMEGISGISGHDQLSAGGAEYSRSRKLMAEDTNAAVRGARAAGATEIVINDSHGSMRNLNRSPEEFGLRFEPVRTQALAAAAQAQDFGLGRSFRINDRRLAQFIKLVAELSQVAQVRLRRRGGLPSPCWPEGSLKGS